MANTTYSMVDYSSISEVIFETFLDFYIAEELSYVLLS